MEHIKTINEVWEDIQGYEGLYQVSNFGRVKSLITNRILKPDKNAKGYFLVTLCRNGKVKRFFVHRLVATMFLENPENKPCVNHIDCDPLNNNVNNLEWCTQKENIRHACKLGRMRRCNTPVIAINLTTKEETYFDSQTEAAEKLNLHQQHISNVLKGKLKKTGNYTFKYIN